VLVRPRDLDAEFGRERDEHLAVAQRPRGRGVTGFDGEHVTRQIRYVSALLEARLDGQHQGRERGCLG